MSEDIVVQTRALSKVYRDFWGRQKVRALKALDLEILRGEVFGLLGPDGSGKTATIKLILGLLFPTEGEAVAEHHSERGQLFGNYNWLPDSQFNHGRGVM